ncbi:Long-chain-fatty-acid--CoA ligase [compost metagenome]
MCLHNKKKTAFEAGRGATSGTVVMPRLTRHYEHWPAGVPHELELPERHLFHYLEKSAKVAPGKTAIHYYGRQLSYGDLYKATLSLAGYLQQHLGIERGDRVLLLMQNCPQFIIAYYAILRCDAVVVAMNPMSTAEEISYYAEDSAGRVLITTQEMLGKAAALLDSGSLAGCVVGATSEYAGRAQDVPFLDIPDFVREPRQIQVRPDVHEFSGALAAGIAPTPMKGGGRDLAVLAYTSGTTGKPKGAMLTQRNFAYVSEQRALWLPEPDDSRALVVLPMSHLAGMCVMNQALINGRSMVMMSRWDASTALELIERLRVTSWGTVTPMVAELFARPDIDQRDLSSIQLIYGGATAMPEALAGEIERRLGVAFIESYGMTESCGGTHINPPHAPRRQCGGIPVINCDARVIDPQSGAELGPNQSGEIVMNSPAVFDGYWNKPEATRAAFIEIDGKYFLRSGDIGHYDEDGYFYITDRLKRMINAAGLKVWPAEIENTLYGHPAVQEACVISAFDAHRGETVKAFVVLRPSARDTLHAEELSEWARTHMAAYKVPRLVEFVDSLPKTASGKTLWRELQQQQNERDRDARAASL